MSSDIFYFLFIVVIFFIIKNLSVVADSGFGSITSSDLSVFSTFTFKGLYGEDLVIIRLSI